LIRQKHIFLVLFVMGMVIACKQKDTVTEESLFGKWDITKAERNGKVTPYLRGGYFVIEKDGKITVNISGSEELTTYTLNKGVIRTKDAKEFVLQSVKPDSMTVHFVANPQSEFVFFMVRNHDTTE
jgi:hypothetical protein